MMRSLMSVALATAFAFGGIFGTASPALANTGDTVIRGTVTDAVTAQPLGNVCVVNGPAASICWTLTNSLGQYVITMGSLTGTYTSPIQFFRSPSYNTTSQVVSVAAGQTATLNVTMQPVNPGTVAPPVDPPRSIVPPLPAPVVPAPVVSVEQRIADFWRRIDALQPTDNVSAADLGGWALNVIEREPRARLTAADFRASTAGMQAGLDRAGLGPVPAVTPTPVPNIEQRIADFWTRIDALQPGQFVSAADLGQWALNVIGRITRAQLSAADFRASTAEMQGGFDRAGLAP